MLFFDILQPFYAKYDDHEMSSKYIDIGIKLADSLLSYDLAQKLKEYNLFFHLFIFSLVILLLRKLQYLFPIEKLFPINKSFPYGFFVPNFSNISAGCKFYK